MHVVGEKPGIREMLHQDVLTARLHRGILDFPVRTVHGYVIDYEFHAGPISEKTVLRNFQYVADLRVEINEPVKPYIISLDSKRTPVPIVEIMPNVYFKPTVIYLSDIDGKKVLSKIKNKLKKQQKLNEMDAYYLALMPFFKHKKSIKEVLNDMCYFVNEIGISEEFKFIIKLIQLLSIDALFEEYEKVELTRVVKMGSSCIVEWERNLIINRLNEVALKMKEDGLDSDFIFKYTGIKI